MKSIYVPVALFISLILLCGSSVSAQTATGEKFAFEQNRRLGRGVNIIGYDPRWKDSTKARMQEKHFTLIKKAGFDNVRIVISPFKFSMNDSAFTINPKFFVTLDWAIQSALKNKLMAIVDFHEHGAMGKDPLGNKSKFLSMWRQIAEHCKGYPNDVLFEVANEPNMKPEIWNEIHREAYDIIRQSNPGRTLLIGSVYGNQIAYLKDLKLPENDRNIIVAIHYYSPIQFTHQGAPWSIKNRDLSGIEWKGTAEEMKAVQLDFDTAYAWGISHKRPITLGEFGAYEKADMASRLRWTNYVARQAELRNWSWTYWQFDSDFVVYDIDKDEWKLDLLNALIPKKP
ncbi:MAG TPA: glycoside hydrolase family 5 protein [Flavisolibacter sp.]